MAALSAEEASWLREAEALKIWRPLGMVSAIDYMERVLGYAPRTAQDRLRVARALGALPRLTVALANGELAFTAVRELTRVATAATEEAWIARATGKSLRQVELLVADHHLGDHPDDPRDPAARMHVVRLELTAETFALLRQARQALDDEHGTSLSEDQLVARLCGSALDGMTANEPSGRARFQIAVTVCERCGQGWQHGAGAKIAIDAPAVERALCDAQHIGSIDGAAPERAYQDVSPSVARLVWHRDGGRCRTPGCRSSRGLEIHHVVHRADGGSHEATNLVILCSACHQAHHAGTLAITGCAEHLEITRPGDIAPRAAHAALVATPRLVGLAIHAAVGPAPSGTSARPGVANTGAHVGARAADHMANGSVQVGVRVADGMANSGAHVGARTVDNIANRSAHMGADPDDTRTVVERREDALSGGPRSPYAQPDAMLVAAAAHSASMQADAEAALGQMGWKPAIARAAVASAITEPCATLEMLIVSALRRCPRRAN